MTLCACSHMCVETRVFNQHLRLFSMSLLTMKLALGLCFLPPSTGITVGPPQMPSFLYRSQ